MRLSGLLLAAILVAAATLSVPHASGAPGSPGVSGSSASHSTSSGSASASHSVGSHSSSGSASHSSSGVGAAARPSPSSKVPGAGKAPNARAIAEPEDKKGRSFFHPFRKPKPVEKVEFIRPQPCWRKPCAVCPPGQSRNGRGACVAAILTNNCLSGPYGSGLFCGAPYWLSNRCKVLADELAAQERRMQGQNDPGQSLEYERLRAQYAQCLARMRGGFAAFAFYASDGESLFDVP
jgi:hypothetical protein